jgi:hypothetical protein
MSEPQKSSRPLDEFFRHESFESLARAQRVSAAMRLEDFQGGWPEDQLDDGFEAVLDTWRQPEARRETG